VGLGNPGIQYAQTRHNVGFQVIDRLGRALGVRVNDLVCRAFTAQAALAGKCVILAKPLTYVNCSGEAVKAMVTHYKIEPAEILVVCDDMDLEVGRLRLRRRGGSGGHNGLKSIINELGTSNFPRLRIGIGRPDGDPINHVLGCFAGEEKKIIEESIEKAAEAVRIAVCEGLEAAMNRFNG